MRTMMRAKVHSTVLAIACLGVFSSVTAWSQIPKGKILTIMPLGDSLTVGFPGGGGGYRQYLQQYLANGGYHCVFVGKEDALIRGTSIIDPAGHTGYSDGMCQPNHEGYAGMRIDELTNGGAEQSHFSLPIQATMANNAPDVVLLMAGMNDILQNYDKPAASAGYQGGTGFAADAAERLYELVGRILGARQDATVVLADVTPLRNTAFNDRARAFNAYVPKIVDDYRKKGYRILFADMRAAFDAASQSADGVHPTAAGYQGMACVWYRALTGQEPPTAPIVHGPAIAFSDASYNNTRVPGRLGYTFITGPSGLTVTALGYINDGFGTAHKVQLFRVTSQPTQTGGGTGVPVPGATATVTTKGGGLNSTSFTYASIPPVKLLPNTEYEIVGTTNGNGFFCNAFNPIVNGVTFGHSVYHFYSSEPAFAEYTYAAWDLGCFGPNFVVEGSAPSGVPARPAGLSAVGGPTQVTLSWSPADGAGWYSIYRGTRPGSEGATPIATGVRGTSFIDTGLAAGSSYYYFVSAVNVNGEGPRTYEVAASPAAGGIARNANVRIMPLGDSITAGYPVVGGYRQPLQDLLRAKGYTYSFVGRVDQYVPSTMTFVPTSATGYSGGMIQPSHEGYRGHRIDELATGVNNGVYNGSQHPLTIERTIAIGNPDVVLLLAGTNDAAQGYDPGGLGYNHEPGFAGDAAARLDLLIERILGARAGVMVVVASITPTHLDSDIAGVDERVQGINRYLPLIVDKYRRAGFHIALADMSHAFAPSAETVDGIHPTGSGYQGMARAWFQAITGLPAVQPTR